MNGKFILLMLFVCINFVVSNGYADTVLGTYHVQVDQIYQQKTNWCWAACAQMVLGYYGFNETQTDIAAYGTPLLSNIGNFLCFEKIYAINIPNLLIQRGIGLILNYFGNIQSTCHDTALSVEQMGTEIAIERDPFIIEWTWDSGGGHFVVAYGYILRPWSQLELLCVRDPWYGPTVNTFSWMIYGGGHTWTRTLTVD